MGLLQFCSKNQYAVPSLHSPSPLPLMSPIMTIGTAAAKVKRNKYPQPKNFSLCLESGASDLLRPLLNAEINFN